MDKKNGKRTATVGKIRKKHPESKKALPAVELPNSLTSQVQEQVNTLCKNTAWKAGMDFERTASANIRQNLLDRSYEITPDYLIRRALQLYHEEWLAGISLPDLKENANIPWDEAAVQAVADVIIAKTRGTGFKNRDWVRFLSPYGSENGLKELSKINRETVFQIAFALELDEQQTAKLLLAFHKEPYCVRNPLDFICLFAHGAQDKYTWPMVKKMYMCYREQRKKLEEQRKELVEQEDAAPEATVGMTEQMETAVRETFQKYLPEEKKSEALIAYMLEHYGEFPEFLTQTGFKEKNPLSGFSYIRMAKMMELSRYLVTLYPDYYTEGGQEAQVDRDEEGCPVLSQLAAALLHHSGWGNIKWQDSKNVDSEAKRAFEEMQRVFCHNLQQDMRRVDRLRRKKDYVRAFQRNDALLFIFFLFSAFVGNKSSKQRDVTWARIQNLLDQESELSRTIKDALNKVIVACDKVKIEDSLQKYRMLRTAYDMLLTKLGFMQIYMPHMLDRLYLLALMGEDPQKMAAYIMCEAVHDHESDIQYADLSLPDEEVIFAKLELLEARVAPATEEKDMQTQENVPEEDMEEDIEGIIDEEVPSEEILHQEFLENTSGDNQKAREEQSQKKSKKTSKKQRKKIDDCPAVDSMRQYLKEIGEVKLLSQEEEQALSERIKAGDKEARNCFVKANLRLVAYFAKKYANYGVDLEDLIQAGNEKLLTLVDGFDWTKGKFSTYAAFPIRTAIMDEINRQIYDMGISNKMMLLIWKVQGVEEKYNKLYNRNPSDAEIQTELKISSTVLERIRDAIQSTKRISQDTPMGDSEEGEDTFGDTIASSAPSLEEMAQREECREAIENLMEELDPWEKTVLKIRLGFFSTYQHEFPDVAQVLNISEELARRIYDAGKKNLRMTEIFQKLQYY